MLNWLNQNADSVNALSSVGVMLIWTLYATLFYGTYARQTKPRIVIDQFSGPGTRASCVLTNLSGQSLYLECVLAVASTPNGTFKTILTEHPDIEPTQQKREIVSLAKRGPLEPGQLVIIGTLEELARRAVTACGGAEPALRSLESLEIRVAAMTSVRDRPVGALKRFRVNLEDGTGDWQSARLGTTQLRSRRSQRRVREWLQHMGRSG